MKLLMLIYCISATYLCQLLPGPLEADIGMHEMSKNTALVFCNTAMPLLPEPEPLCPNNESY